MASYIERRKFLAALGGAVAGPLAARAQQAAMPVIGFLGSTSLQGYRARLHAFAVGLKEEGYIEGQNVVVEYRLAEDHDDRLPVLSAELVRRQVRVIAAGGSPASVAAKAATATIPIVFETASDPVTLGLVASLSRPGGNLTGVTNLNVEVGQKKLELLRELLPSATNIAILVNPSSATITEQFMRALQAAAPALGMQLHVLYASTDRDLDAVFAALRTDALVIGPYLFFNSRMERLGALTLRYAVPAIFTYRPFVAAGGLMSYGADETETYRLVGIYTGKILKGANPGDLPIQRVTKVELIINLKTAKALGIAVPLALSGRADEVIE
ncbi:ABC transporter substrate-binding protein [Bradyrhizobium sp. Tv2a-2]|uniref:ABC transporter substrate-binding protein n=1 Tax=Bradyrhizobium sp. Tv2a-2 TaxID=113395 RepID=UPI0003FDAF45|nr:ABC transporter substrate-binding protein [Bradyrhizobium sp. Tv2a-2]